MTIRLPDSSYAVVLDDGTPFRVEPALSSRCDLKNTVVISPENVRVDQRYRFGEKKENRK